MDIENQNKKILRQYKPKVYKIATGSYLIAAAAVLSFHFLLKGNVIVIPAYQKLAINISLAAGISLLILGISSFAQSFVLKRSKQKYLRYNLVQIIKLLSALIVILIFISFIFHNWYTAAVSLGLISLVLGFALQTPISSFIGWLYIIFRSPYHIGDRIQINEFKGDVVEIGYLDTTLWEFGGNYLTSDIPTGRLIRFPNSLVFQSSVYNYSWQKFPYIWNEIPFHIAYESDIEYVEEILKKVAKEVLGPEMEKHAAELKQLVAQTPVDELDIKEVPFVTFRTNTNTWLEATVIYLVYPKQASLIRTQIVKMVLKEASNEPEKVMFPKTNAR